MRDLRARVQALEAVVGRPVAQPWMHPPVRPTSAAGGPARTPSGQPQAGAGWQGQAVPVAPQRPVGAPQPWPPPAWTPPPGDYRSATGPRPRREINGAHLLGIAGGLVLIVGSTLLFVLAGQYGHTGRLIQVGVGAVLAIVLAVTAVLVRRQSGGNGASVALLGTTVAVAYLDVAAMAMVLGLVVPVAGAIGALIAMAGLAVAWAWRSQIVGTIAAAGALVMVPVVCNDSVRTGVILVLVLVVVTVPASWRPGWWPVLAARIVPAALYLVTLATTPGTDHQVWDAALVGGTVLAVLPLLDWWVLPRGVALMARWHGGAPDPDRETQLWHALCVPVTSLALLLLAMVRDSTASGVLAVAVGVVALVQGSVPAWLRGRHEVHGILSSASGVLLVMAGINVLSDGPVTGVMVALLGLVTLAQYHIQRHPSILVVALVAAVPCLGIALGRLFNSWSPAPDQTLSALLLQLVAGTLATATVVWALVSVGRCWVTSQTSRSGWTVAAVAVGCVLLGGPMYDLVRAFSRITGTHPAEDGRVLAGGLTTVLAALAIATMLVRSRGRDDSSRTRRIGGYWLLGAVIIKLVLVDLIGLDGLVRVVVFLLVGALLLALAVVWSKSLETPADGDEPAGERKGGGPHRPDH